jgi:hypothetical protein
MTDFETKLLEKGISMKIHYNGDITISRGKRKASVDFVCRYATKVIVSQDHREDMLEIFKAIVTEDDIINFIDNLLK